VAKAFAASVLLVLLVPGGQLSPTVVRTADPIKRGLKESDFPRTIKVTDHVYTYEDFHAGAEKFTTTDLFVVTPEGVFVADGQGSPAATRGLVDAIRKITDQPIRYVAICSDHGDHTGGNASFPPGVAYLIHPTSKATLDKQAAARPDAWKLPASATLVFDKYTIAMGGEQFQILFLGRAHTGGDLSVFLPKSRILFLSETFLNRVFPAMRSAYPTDWLGALTRAEQMNADIYIPGHGFTESAAVSREELRTYHAALQAVIAEATRLYKAGVPVEDAVKQAHFGEYSSWTLAAGQAPIAIRKVYEELSGQLK
jgi:glyoxylase-like metal-dependent hydrolase (beta-lactamase superfamily II)